MDCIRALEAAKRVRELGLAGLRQLPRRELELLRAELSSRCPPLLSDEVDLANVMVLAALGELPRQVVELVDAV